MIYFHLQFPGDHLSLREIKERTQGKKLEEQEVHRCLLLRLALFFFFNLNFDF